MNMRWQVIGVATFQGSLGQNLNFVVSGERVSALRFYPRQSLPAWNAAVLKDLMKDFNLRAALLISEKTPDR